MSTIWKEIQYKVLRSASKINLLIGINIIVFLFINLSKGLSRFSDQNLQLPASPHALGAHFWTPLTYMFVHDDIFHIIFNMLWLYWIGVIFEDFIGKGRTVGLYLLGGLAGAFLFVFCYNVFPYYTNLHLADSSILAGASASVMAILIATATLAPDSSITLLLIGQVRLKWIAIFFVAVDILGITGANAGGKLSHLGGALIGYIYIKQLRKGNDWIEILTKFFKPRPKLRVVTGNPLKNASYIPRQEEIDLILDKISKSGYDSLSKQEKEVLFRASKQE